MSLDISLPAWQAISTVFHVLAIFFTSFRLYRRYKLHQLWWDDYWAGFTLLLELAFFSSVWLRQEIGGGTQASPKERHRRVVLFWISGITSHLVVWFARISMCVSMARIDMRVVSIRIRKSVYALTFACAMFACAISIQRVWVCANRTDWHKNENVQCYMGRALGYISLTGDILVDTCLTIIPFNLLRRVRLHKRRRRLILGLFTGNMLSTIAGVLYAVTMLTSDKLGKGGLIIALAANIKATVTLMVCNLLVVVTYVYSLFWKSNDDSDSETESEEEEEEEKRSRDDGPRPNTVFDLTEFTDAVTYSWQTSTQQSGAVTSTSMASPKTESGRDPAREDPQSSLPLSR